MASVLSRLIGLKTLGREWYEQKFLPKISPITLIALPFPIRVLKVLRLIPFSRSDFDGGHAGR